MLLKDFIDKINFTDDNFYFRFAFDSNVIYAGSTDLKTEGLNNIMKWFYDEEEIPDAERVDISSLKIDKINLMSTPLMVSIELEV